MVAILIVGLVTGGIYALCALGLVSIYRGSRVLNFALGASAAWGGYAFAYLRDDRGWAGLLAVVAVIGGAAICGALVYLLLIRPIRRRPETQKIVMTLGLSAALTSTLTLVFGTQVKAVEPIYPTNTLHLLGANVGLDQLLVLATALVLAGILGVWSARGRLALASRALADNEVGIEAMGYSPHVLGALNWALGSGVAALAGIMLAPVIGLTPTSLGVLIVPALAAGVIGNFESYGWAVLGGLIVGVAESLLTRYVGGAGWSSLVPLAMVLGALLLRSRTAGNRPSTSPTLAISRELAPANIAFFALFAVVLVVGSVVWAQAAIISMCFAILGLSVVIITGYGNQISLGQMAIAGIAGLICIHLYADASVPFILLPIIGALIGGVLGVLVGIPALRLSGANLAVLTIAGSVAVEQLIFNSPAHWLTGTGGSLQIPEVTFFGQNVAALTNPEGYGFVVLGWLVLATIATVLVRRSRFGHTLLAVRANERVAAATGIDVSRTKTMTFAISAALAGVGGVLLVFSSSFATFTSGYGYAASIALLILVMLGGATSARGGLQAGLIASSGLLFVALTDIKWVSENLQLIFSLGLIGTVLVYQNGGSYIPLRKSTDARLPDEASEGRPAKQLALDDVSVSFGGVAAVSGVSLASEPGKVIGMIGPNGAGKTTVLDAACGYVDSSGSVALGEQSLNGVPTHGRARAGLARVFQGVELFEDLSVAENLMMPIEARTSTAGSTPPAAGAWLKATGTDDLLTESPTELSLGARKLIAVARALMADPAVLLLDEPGAGMGHAEREVLADSILLLSREHGISVVLVDHDMPLVEAVCDVVYVMADGAVLTKGTPREVFADRRVQDIYLGADTPSDHVPGDPTTEATEVGG